MRLHKKHIVFGLKIAIAVVIVWYLFHSGRLTSEIFTQLFNSAFVPFFIMSGSAFLVAQLLASYRLVLLLRMIDLNFSFSYILKLTMVGNFFNIVIPGMVGGDIVKGSYLFKKEENHRGRSSGIVLMDRMMGFVALLFIGLVSIIYLYLLQHHSPLLYIDELSGVVLISFGVLVLFALLWFFGKKQWFRMKAKAIAYILFKDSIFYNMTDAIGALTKRRRILAKAFCMSLGVQAFALAGLLVLIRLIPGNMPDIATLIAVSSIILLFGIIPVTPGNIGWTELVASIGWSVVGSTMGGVIFFYWRIVCILFSLPGGLLYLLPGNYIPWEQVEATALGETMQK